MKSELIVAGALVAGLTVGAVRNQEPEPESPSVQAVPVVADSEVVPAQSVNDGRSMMDAPEAVAPALPRYGGWIKPGVAGPPDEYIYQYIATSQWGWGLGNELPLHGESYMLGGSGNAVVMTMYEGVKLAPVRLALDRIYGCPPALGQSNTVKWGFLLYDARDQEFDRVIVHDIPIEHGYYMTGWGKLRWKECLFEDINGQAIQHVYSHPDNPKRAHQTGLPRERWLRLAEGTKREWIEIVRCETKQVGIPPKSERASYTYSFFEALDREGPVYNPVRVDGCFSETSYPWTDQNNVQRDCAGWFMAHARLGVELTNNAVLYRKGDRDVVQIWGCSDGLPNTPDVVLRRNYFNASKPIDIRLRTVDDTVIIERNVGNTEVVISGPAQGWYVWGNTGFKEEHVLYRGPVSQAYRLN